MDSSLTTALIAVAGVGVLAVLLRRLSGRGSETIVAPPSPDAVLDEIQAEVEPDGFESEDPVAVTSDGQQFVPMGQQVQLLPPEDPEAAGDAPEGVHPHGGERLNAGDFTGARVRRGSGGFGPWRLEALGPEGEYLPFPFETEDAARSALAMLESRGIVRAPRDEDGTPLPPSPEEFEEARRRHEETENQLATWADEPLEDES
jgi:hypothetical protein